MKRDTHLFYDCCEFWKRMGVKKEDNIIAFALADLIVICKKDFMLNEWEDYYKAIYLRAQKEAIKPIYNKGRGTNGFLANSGL